MKRSTLLFSALIALLPGAAQAGSVDARAGTDFLRGSTGGDGTSFAAQEIGLRFVLNLAEFDDRLHVHVDYRGREPIGGDV